MAIPFSLWPSVMTDNLGPLSFNAIQLIITILFISACITDAIDGHIARKKNIVTNFGKFMDPLADKFLVNSTLILLVSSPQYWHDIQTATTIPVLIVVLMVGRDIAVDGLRLLASKSGEVIAANIYGKIKTVMQMIVIPMILLGGFPYSLITLAGDYTDIVNIISTILLGLTCLMSVISGIIYIIKGKKVLKGGNEI